MNWKQKNNIYFIKNWNKLSHTRIARHEAWLIWIRQIVVHQVLKNSIKNGFFKMFTTNRLEGNRSIIIQTLFVPFMWTGYWLYHLYPRIAACRYYKYKLVWTNFNLLGKYLRGSLLSVDLQNRNFLILGSGWDT